MDSKLIQSLLIAAAGFLLLGITLTVADVLSYSKAESAPRVTAARPAPAPAAEEPAPAAAEAPATAEGE